MPYVHTIFSLDIINLGIMGQGYISISQVGLYGCARYCGMDSGCKSFTFNTKYRRCLLHEDDANTAPGQFEEAPGYIYGDRAAVVSDENLMGTCRDHGCPNFTTCVGLSSGSRICVVSACGPTTFIQYHEKPDDVSATLTPVGVTRYQPCEPGYVGRKTVICLANGNWLETTDNCRDCGNPPSVSNAAISDGNNTIGSTRTYECVPRTSASGSGDITCLQNGNWSESSLECVPDCVVVTLMQNAYTTATVAPAGTTISYRCDVGYVLSAGTGNRYCNTHGLWEPLDISCDPVYCGLPSVPSGVSGYSYGSLTYQQTVMFYCSNILVSTNPGNMYVTCQSDGTWSPPAFQCV